MTKSVVGVHEARTHWRLLARVPAGEEIVIERRGQPIAVLRGSSTSGTPRTVASRLLDRWKRDAE
jgi:antitoxin (DNA-binding transcriptional repressor) of toxin-antitoxin stability system